MMLRALIFAMMAVGAAHAADNPPRTYDVILGEAQAAFSAEDYAVAAARLDEAQSYRPFSLFLTRNRVLARYLAGDVSGAVDIASGLASRGLALDLPATAAFDRLRADPSFAPVLARFDANRRPLGEPVIIREFTEAALLPEAIAPSKQGMVIGSVRTGGVFEAGDSGLREIVKLDGGVFDLAASTDGAVMVAVVNDQLAYEQSGSEPPKAAFVVFDLPSGPVRSTFTLAETDALLGDIEADRDAFYASDSLTPRVFRLAGENEISVLADDPRFANVQGLALDRKNRRLYIADYLTGLFVVDLRSKAVTQIANPTDAHLGGIDGLYLYKGDLVGVQNGTTPQRIVRIDLDRAGKVARSLRVLQQALPEWNEPTHGFIDGDRFIYIATSNWPAYGEDGAVRDGAILQPLRLMAVSLD